MRPSGEDIHGHTHMGTRFGHRGTLRCSKAPAVLRSQGGREVPGRSLQQKDQFVLESQWQGRGVLPTGYEDAAANLPPNTHTISFLVRVLWALGSESPGLCTIVSAASLLCSTPVQPLSNWVTLDKMLPMPQFPYVPVECC